MFTCYLNTTLDASLRRGGYEAPFVSGTARLRAAGRGQRVGGARRRARAVGAAARRGAAEAGDGHYAAL